MVGFVIYDAQIVDAYFCVDKQYNRLKPEMLEYVIDNLSKDGVLNALINDNDREFQRVALKHGFHPTQQEKEYIAILDVDSDLLYALPKGYKIINMSDEWKRYQNDRCLWRGFNHEGRPPQKDEDIAVRKEMLSSPCVKSLWFLLQRGVDSTTNPLQK